ncbi:hypothetical protein AGOR_G00120620 [Albula goreensis]|uniref:Ig-like domain-containing protein n=1 Tax=Albula goreensis TaxID=1534307 RepID=A0A8T3DBP0_9TELE|nr:hypothetical protein AGOR_G00120620 [Albula goreensis]
MTCKIVCTHMRNSPAFIWYQNGKSLQNTNQELQFTASSGDTGRYSCAVGGYENLLSNEVTLSVECTKIQVKPDTVTEGQVVTLTCITTCTHLSNSQTFTWYKNGESLSITNQDLQLTARRGDSGRYSCAVQDGHNHLLSSAVTLSVNYPPKSTTVSVSPSGVIKEGSSVTLTCSSDANPPVQRYTWFKKTGAGSSERGTGESYTFTNISSEDSGQYYCEAQNQHGALNSPAVTVDVQYGPKNTSVSVNPSGEVKEGSSVTLTCSSDANPPVQSYTWFKKNESGVWQTGSGQSLNFSNFRSWNSGLYYCETQNTHGTHNATTKLIMKDSHLFRNHVLVICAAGGITVFVALAFIAATVCVCKRRRNPANKTELTKVDKERSCSAPHNDTYTALNLKTVSPDYDTLSSAHPDPQDDTYTGLNLAAASPDYDTLNVKVS